MCLILVSWRQHGAYPLVLAANRDEFHERPTRAAGYWDDAPGVLAGRDLRHGGTWLGVERSGRIAAVTNIREPSQQRDDVISRGRLPADYLTGDTPPAAYMRAAAARAAGFDAFNLLAGDPNELWFLNSRAGVPVKLEPGLYGISNGALDCPWPKVKRGKQRMRELIPAAGAVAPVPALAASLLEILADDTVAPDAELPDTGVGIELERMLAPAFIRAGHYGTRSSSVIIFEQGRRAHFRERSFDNNGVSTAEQAFTFALDG